MTCPECGSHKGLLLSYALFAGWVKCYGCSKLLVVREPPRRTDVWSLNVNWDAAIQPLKEMRAK